MNRPLPAPEFRCGIGAAEDGRSHCNHAGPRIEDRCRMLERDSSYSHQHRIGTRFRSQFAHAFHANRCLGGLLSRGRKYRANR